MSKIFIFILLFFSELSCICQIKEVCFSYDDLPVVNYNIPDTAFQKQIIDRLINSLKKNDIPAIGFFIGEKLYENNSLNPFRVNLLKSWVSNGLDLGNHTFSHPDYNSVSFKNYTRDISKNEKTGKRIPGIKRKKILYFRHPYLHVGSTKSKADSLDNYLSDHDYKVAPVTIDNEDYLFALAYQRAKIKDNELLMLQIGHDYVDYMERKLIYYEKQSDNLFGRKISQILLLHASYLNSVYTDSLAMMFRKNNYTFVNLDKALEDEAYKSAVTVYLKAGISWIDKWALSRGRKGDFFKDEPETPLYIRKLAE